MCEAQWEFKYNDYRQDVTPWAEHAQLGTVRDHVRQTALTLRFTCEAQFAFNIEGGDEKPVV